MGEIQDSKEDDGGKGFGSTKAKGHVPFRAMQQGGATLQEKEHVSSEGLPGTEEACESAVAKMGRRRKTL